MLDISSSLMQQAVTDVWRAYRNFFAGRTGYPRYKSKKRDTPRFRYPAGVRVSGESVFLPRIGWVRLRLSRQIDGRLKSATVKRCGGRWFVLALAEFEIDDIPATVREPYRCSASISESRA
jgi:putative transposase